jgi:hypothetical protein
MKTLKTEKVKFKRKYIPILEAICKASEKSERGVLLGKFYEESGNIYGKSKPIPYGSLNESLEQLRKLTMIKNENEMNSGVNIAGIGLRFKRALYISATEFGKDFLQMYENGASNGKVYDDNGNSIKKSL